MNIEGLYRMICIFRNSEASGQERFLSGKAIAWGLRDLGSTYCFLADFPLTLLCQLCRCWSRCKKTKINLGTFASCVGRDPLCVS